MQDVNTENIRYLIIDVDGTMTDSGIYYDNENNEFKRFSTRDGEAIKLAKILGIKIIVITGRKCCATKRRMDELKIDFYEQGVLNKYDYIVKFLESYSIKKSEICYIGDDINDLKAMSLAGYVCCPSDSCKEVKKIANYVSNINGGYGAVRDAIEHILRKCNKWDKALSEAYKI